MGGNDLANNADLDEVIANMLNYDHNYKPIAAQAPLAERTEPSAAGSFYPGLPHATGEFGPEHFSIRSSTEPSLTSSSRTAFSLRASM